MEIADVALNSETHQMKEQHDKASNKDTTVSTEQRIDGKQGYETMRQTHAHKQRFTCSLMEQAEFGEDRSSISDPLDPEDVTLIWSAGTFLDPSLVVRRLKTEIKLELASPYDDNNAVLHTII